jgi:cytochrome c oxidase subunit IV
MTTSATPHVSLRAYIVTYVGLLGLATLSLVLSGLPDTAAFTVSMFIAVIKAIAVLLFFMHLIEQRFSYRFVMIVSALLVCILIALTTLDPMTRAPYPPPPSQNAAFRLVGR